LFFTSNGDNFIVSIMTRFTFISVFCLALLASCSNIVEYELADVQPFVVVDAIISTDSTWVVSLNYSRPLNAVAPPRKVEGAEIQVSILIDGNLGATEENIAQKLKLEETSPGYYALANNPTEGRTYHMEVRVGDEVLTAKTYVPKVFTPQIERKISSEDGSFQLEVELGTELEESIHYAYSIVPIAMSKDGNVGMEDETDSDAGDITMDEGNLIPEDEGIVLTRNLDLNTATPISGSDGLIGTSGIRIESTLSAIRTSGSNDANSDNTPITDTNQEFTLKIWAISNDYYQYLVSQNGNDFRPSSEFDYQNQYSNINNGGGIFAGYNLKEINIEL